MILGVQVALRPARRRRSDPPRTGPLVLLVVGLVGATTQAVPAAPVTRGILRPPADRHRARPVDHQAHRISHTGRPQTRRV